MAGLEVSLSQPSSYSSSHCFLPIVYNMNELNFLKFVLVRVSIVVKRHHDQGNS